MTNIQFAVMTLMLVAIIGTMMNNHVIGEMSLYNVIKDTFFIIAISTAAYLIVTLAFATS